MRPACAGLFAALVIAGAPASAAASDRAAPRPNVVVVLADDLGYSDLSSYGGEIPTPAIDRLAAGGLRFTRFYNAGRCCPTRASLLTGLYPHETGVGHMLGDDGLRGYRGRLNRRGVTIAEVLREAGYFTAMTGKWHVGQEHGVVPWERGFTRSLSAPTGGFYYGSSPRARLFLDGRELPPDAPELPSDWYATDLWTDFGLKFVDEARAAGKPFFLYLAHVAPHFPLQAPAEEIARFRERYRAGWDQLRERRFARQKELGLFPPHATLPPRPEAVTAWSELETKERERFTELMAIYAACVSLLDTAVGRLVEGLRARDVLDDTLILFLSDNGGSAESGFHGRSVGAPLGSPGSVVYAGEAWALLQNTPFRQYKHYVHEGGIATPLVAHWPNGIRARGELTPERGHVIDFMATFLELAGARYPESYRGHVIAPSEGRSLVPAFAGKPVPRDALYWEHEGNAAISRDTWKLVRLGPDGPWELYDLANDPAESANLAGAHLTRVTELAADWQRWAERAWVVPAPARRTKVFPR